MENKLLLIDGHSILNRAFYALPLLTGGNGEYTNAVYGFLSMFFKVMEEVQPDHLAVAFDLPAPTFRHKMYDAYKGTRKPMPEEMRPQVPLMKKVLQAMGVTILEQEGFEADDLIGSAAAAGEKAGLSVTILSGDRDLLQLVTEKTTLKLPKTSKGSTTVETFTPARVEEVYQVKPSQIVDLKAMMGDSSDNIPGLPGIGEKTATNLILQYGSLENAHAHAEEIKPKKAQSAMLEHYELGELSQKLARIKTDIPMEEAVPTFKIENLYTPEAYALYKELNFKNLLPRFEMAGSAPAAKVTAQIITDPAEAKAVLAKAVNADAAGFYLDAEDGTVRGLALAAGGEPVYIPAGEALTDKELTAQLREILKSVPKTATFRFKEQQNILESEPAAGLFDCEIAAYLIDPLRSAYPYEQIAMEYAGVSIPSEEEIVGGKITKKTVVTPRQQGQIAASCAYAAYVCAQPLKEKLAETGMEQLFTEVEMPFAYTLSAMERAGIRMNTERLQVFSRELSEKIEEVQARIYEQAGEEFNIQSPKQLGVILFEKLHLPGGKKTKSGYSTAVDVLEKLAPDAPIVNDVLTYRQLTKLRSTYADALGNYVAADGRIHSHFQQTVTATGRISSADPNLQNIPVRMELGREIRKVFVPEENCVFVDADYSQIELRVLAHMANDEKLIDAYRQHSDIHRITASQVFGVPLEEVTSLQRRNAKAVNFGIVYGISSFGLSQDLSITRREAQEYIEKYFETYPEIKNWLEETVASAKEKGYTTTLYGRRRPVPELKASNFMQRSFGERVAMNAPVQGTAADIIKIAMNRVYRRLLEGGYRTRLILQVHDELLLEAPQDEAEEVCALLQEEMEHAAQLRVKLEVDLNTGRNWDEAH